jgi:hypothetical protein
MSSGNSKLFWLLLGLLLAPAVTLADGRPWAVGLGVQADVEGSSSVVASFDIAATETTWLRASGSFGQSPNSRGDIQTTTASVGVDQSFGPVGLTLDLQQWGDPDLVESTDVKASFYFRNDDVSVAVLGERRNIDLTFSVTGLGGQVFSRSADFDADGWGLRLSAKPNDRWRVYARGRKYDYSVNLSALPRIQVVDFLFSSTLTLANSLVDFETSFGVERSFGERSVSLNYGRDRSAVDQTFLESMDLGVLFPVGKRVDLELSFGFSDSDDFGSEAFGGFYIYIYGG